MKNKFLVALAFLGLGTPAFAQFSDSTETKNHLGIIAKPRLEKIFTANQSLPVGLIYKRQIKQDQAIRFSVMGSYYKHKNDPINNNIFQVINRVETTNTSYQVMAGYEWQKQLAKKWSFYYGSDFGFAQTKNESTPNITVYQPNYPYAITTNYWHSKTNNLVVQPFAGFGLHVSSRLYFAIETAITATKSKSENILFKYDSASENTEGRSEKIGTDTVENFIVRYFPISNLQLVYRF